MWWWCGGPTTSYPDEDLVQHLRPDSTVWPRHTYSVWPWSDTPKIPLYCTEYNQPTTCIQGHWNEFVLKKSFATFWTKLTKTLTKEFTNNSFCNFAYLWLIPLVMFARLWCIVHHCQTPPALGSHQLVPLVGAVLIKNYSSFEKYVKKVPRGFS